MSRTTMPIMGSKLITSIPWTMIAPHEKQAQANHGQSLNRLAERGGLCSEEVLDIIEGRRWGSCKVCIENQEYLVRLVAAWGAQNAAVVSEGDTFRALIEFLLVAEEPIAFLRAWNEGNFETCRREWPEAPPAVYPVQKGGSV